MSNTSPFERAFINATAAFEASRLEYSLLGIDPVELLTASHNQRYNLDLSLYEEAVLRLHLAHVNEYNTQAAAQFNPINGFHLIAATGGLIALSDKPLEEHSGDEEPDNISLTASISEETGVFEMRKTEYKEGRAPKPLPRTQEDYELVSAALVELGALQSLLCQDQY